MINQSPNQIYEAGIPKTRFLDPKKKPVYWWSNEIAELRKKCYKAKRITTRKKGDIDSMNHYRTERISLRVAIKKAKKKAWELLINEVQNDPWGLPYKIFTKKFGHRNVIPGIKNGH